MERTELEPTAIIRPDEVVEYLEPLSRKYERRDSKVWASGQRIGPYRVEGILGRGGMGIVYRGVHSELRRPVALKQIFVDGALDVPDAIARFRREAEVLASLDHPYLVRVYEVGEADELPFMAMELVEGHSFERILREKLLPLRSLVQILQRVAEGVAAAHARGIVHRDLKPSNVLVDASTGAPRILDFGLAVQDAGTRDRLTRTGEIVGTAEYMAPEQVELPAKGPSAVTPRIDVYALGVMLYEILTGVTPFGGGTALEVLFRRTTDDPLAPRWLVPSLPRDLEAICLACLERDPARRYPDAAALAADLGRWLAGEPISVRAPSPARRMVAWARRHRRILAASGILGVLLAALAWAGASSWRARRETEDQRQANVRTATHWMARQIDVRLAEGQAACETLARIVEMFPDPAASEDRIQEFIARTLRTRANLYGSCVAFEPDAFRPGQRHHMPYYHRSASQASDLAFLYPDYAAYDYHSMAWYRGAAEDQTTTWTSAYYDENAGDVLMITCAAPFYADAAKLHAGGAPTLDERREHFRGVATVDVALDHIHGEMNQVRFGKDGYAFLVEKDGRILTFPERPAPFPSPAEVELERRFADLFDRPALRDLIEEAGAVSTGAVRRAECPYLGRPAYFTAVVLRGTAWRLVTVCPVEEADRDPKRLLAHAP